MTSNIDRLMQRLNLGALCAEPRRLEGGFLHTVYAVETTRGKFVVKHLNPAIMRRGEAVENFRRSEMAARRFAETIPAVVAIVFNGETLIRQESLYFQIFPFVPGRSLYPGRLKAYHCARVGELLGRIHTALCQTEFAPGFPQTRSIEISWQALVTAGKNETAPWAEELLAQQNRLYEWNHRAVTALETLNRQQIISHRDLDPKNILWDHAHPVIIDWEAAGRINPQQELIEALLHWTVNENGVVIADFARALLQNYRQFGAPTPLPWNIAADGGLASHLEWLAYNLGRSVGVGGASAEEQELAGEQVLQTLRELDSYDSAIEELAAVL